MSNGQSGILILQDVPAGEVEKKVIEFLAKFAKRARPERIAEKIQQTPYVLSKNISAEKALKIIEALQKLGASAVFVPHTSRDTAAKPAMASELSDAYKLSSPALMRGKTPAVQTKPQNGRKRLLTFLVLILLLLLFSYITWQLYPLFADKLHELGIGQQGFLFSPEYHTAFHPIDGSNSFIVPVA